MGTSSLVANLILWLRCEG